MRGSNNQATIGEGGDVGQWVLCSIAWLCVNSVTFYQAVDVEDLEHVQCKQFERVDLWCAAIVVTTLNTH